MLRLFSILFLILLLSTLAFAQGSSIGSATAITVNGSSGGSISDQSTDHYWKITLISDGYLRVEVNSISSIDLNVSLYDTDGSTYITGDGRAGTYSESFAFLKPGTYYAKVYRWTGTAGSYTISNSFQAPPKTADSELNDYPTQAVLLNANATGTGHVGFYGNKTTDNQDYWKITTTTDGWLRVQVRSDSLDLRGDTPLDLNVSLYDVDSSRYIIGDSRNGTFSEVSSFLRPGTYYIRVYLWTGRAGSYEIKSEFFPPPRANDVEGNDSSQAASTATVNGTVTGHLGYFSNGKTDTHDYWKITTTSDGMVKIQVTSDSLDLSGVPLNLNLSLYDIDGTRYLVGDSRTGPYSELTAFLRPGTYYADVYLWTGNAGSYAMTITNTLPPLNNEGEGDNDTYQTASTATVNGTVTGHLGYLSNGKTDTDDYWKFTTTSDGMVKIQVTSDSLDLSGVPLNLNLSLYDVNGTRYLVGDSRTGPYSEVTVFLRPGTYYADAYLWTGNAGSYAMKIVHTPPPLANDVEGNDSSQAASTATVNGTVTGHLGYFSNGKTDTHDYWKITTTSDGMVKIQVTSDSLDLSGVPLNLNLSLYDIDGTRYLAGDSRTGPYSELTAFLRPGTYYADVYLWTGNAGSYAMKVIHTPPSRNNEGEGNDSPSTATSLAYGVVSTGHIGYYSNGTTDTEDYWKLISPSSDSIYVQVATDSPVDVNISIYDSDGTTYLNGDGRAGVYSIAGFKPVAGRTYYVRIYRWTGDGGSYTILATKSSVSVGIEELSEKANIPRQLVLDQNYPNPFNPSTTIRYGLPESQNVRISVFSVLGQEIAVLVNGVQAPSTYTVVWNGKDRHGVDLPSGIYIIRMQASSISGGQSGEKQIVKKAMLVR